MRHSGWTRRTGKSWSPGYASMPAPPTGCPLPPYRMSGRVPNGARRSCCATSTCAVRARCPFTVSRWSGPWSSCWAPTVTGRPTGCAPARRSCTCCCGPPSTGSPPRRCTRCWTSRPCAPSCGGSCTSWASRRCCCGWATAGRRPLPRADQWTRSRSTANRLAHFPPADPPPPAATASPSSAAPGSATRLSRTRVRHTSYGVSQPAQPHPAQLHPPTAHLVRRVATRNCALSPLSWPIRSASPADGTRQIRPGASALAGGAVDKRNLRSPGRATVGSMTADPPAADAAHPADANPADANPADDGPFSRASALAAGSTISAVRAQLRTGAWQRLRRGTYVASDLLITAEAEADAGALHAVAIRAGLLRTHGAAASGTSAARLHGLRIKVAALPVEHVTSRHGVPVTTAARTIVDLGRTLPWPQAVVLANAAVHSGLTTVADLGHVLSCCAGWPGVRAASRAIDFADATAESPLESLTRVFFADHGIEPPVSQHWLGDPRGPIGRVDFYWPRHRTIAEADGLLKCADEGARREEKLRQERLEQAGFVVVRLTWHDVTRTPERSAARLHFAFARGDVLRLAG